MNKEIDAVIFDLGGVLIDWNPSYVFDKMFEDEDQKKHFFENICTSDWNEKQDEGYPIDNAVKEKVAEFYLVASAANFPASGGEERKIKVKVHLGLNYIDAQLTPSIKNKSKG